MGANQNRLTESVEVFTTTFQNKVFASTSCILFLNKLDIFEAKVGKSPIAKFHPDYTEFKASQGAKGDDKTIGKEYIYSLYNNAFRSCSENSRRSLYSHYTTATDTNNISVVFSAVNDTIVQINLQTYGLM